MKRTIDIAEMERRLCLPAGDAERLAAYGRTDALTGLELRLAQMKAERGQEHRISPCPEATSFPSWRAALESRLEIQGRPETLGLDDAVSRLEAEIAALTPRSLADIRNRAPASRRQR